jgi:hypothetical protein
MARRLIMPFPSPGPEKRMPDWIVHEMVALFPDGSSPSVAWIPLAKLKTTERRFAFRGALGYLGVRPVDRCLTTTQTLLVAGGKP